MLLRRAAAECRLGHVAQVGDLIRTPAAEDQGSDQSALVVPRDTLEAVLAAAEECLGRHKRRSGTRRRPAGRVNDAYQLRIVADVSGGGGGI
jgi:hypothetical protein